MDLSPEILVGIAFAGVVVVLLPFALICLGLTSAVNAMSNPNLRIREASRTKHRPLFAAAAEHHEFAGELGFEWLGAFVLKAPQEIFIACWQQPDRPRYFCIYSRPEADYFDFVTQFDRGESLTTASTHDAHTLPFPPGKRVQSFHGADAETLWEHHQRAETYLADRYDLRHSVAAPPEEFPEEIVAALREQMAHVKSYPLWQVSGVIWFLTRGRRSGITIAEQDAAG